MGKDSKDLVSITQLRVVQRFHSTQRWVVVWLRFILIVKTTLFFKEASFQTGPGESSSNVPSPLPLLPRVNIFSSHKHKPLSARE